MSVDYTLSFNGRPVLIYDFLAVAGQLVIGVFDGSKFSFVDLENTQPLFDLIENRRVVLVGFGNAGGGDLLLQFLLTHRHPTFREIADLTTLLAKPWKDRSDQDRKELSTIAYGTPIPWSFTIDLARVIAKPRLSLPAWQCRLGRDRVITDNGLQTGTPVERHVIETALRERIATMAVLLERARPLLAMRSTLIERYHFDNSLFTKSEPQIAEYAVTELYQRATGTSAKELKASAATSPDHTTQRWSVSNLLAPDISFSTPAFQDILHTVSAGHVEKVANRLDAGHDLHAEDQLDVRGSSRLNLVTAFQKNQIEVAGLRCTLGCGGLHSIDAPMVTSSTIEHVVVDYDANSFYPAILIKNELRPAHFGAEFTSILTQLRDDRIAAKRDGDKITANALKIIINSIYGKLRDDYSALRSVETLLRVTLNGQLYLLMLVERLAIIGCTVLSINTDGILVQARRDLLPAMEQTIGAWQDAVQFSLERADIARYWRSSVNDYVAALADGTVKTKGRFNPESEKASGTIIIRAAVAHLIDGIDPADFITRHQVLADFLLYKQAHFDSTLEHNGTHVGTIARWYLSTIRQRLVIRKKDGLSQNVYLGEQATLLPDATGATLATLPDLDRIAYIAAARLLIAQALEGDLITQATTAGERLRSMGVVLAPKTIKGYDLKGVPLDSMDRYQAEFGHHPGYAIVTGPATCTLTIDLDKPELVPAELLQLIPQDTLVSWHGNGTTTDVLSGHKRGAVTLRYAGDDVRIRTKALIDSHGFEVAFGRKHQTVIGLHRSAFDTYQAAGTIQDAPSELISLLGRLLGAPPRSERASTVQSNSRGSLDPNASPDMDARLLRLLVACRAIYGAIWGRISAAQHRVEGPTPGKETDLWVFLRRNGAVGVHSLHQRFNMAQAAALIQAEYDRVAPAESANSLPPLEPLDRLEVPPPLDAEETQEAASVAAAFESPDKLLLVAAPTGSGKTYQECAHGISRHRKGLRTLIIVQDKEAMAQVDRYLRKQWEDAGHPSGELKRQMIDANQIQDLDDNVTTNSRGSQINDSTMIVITHHHFGSRKKLTRILYPTLRWIEEHSVAVIIDEFDLYVDRQNLGFDLDARYVHIGGGFAPWQKISSCMTRGGTFKCKQCVKRSCGSLASKNTHLEFSLPHYVPRPEFHVSRANEFTIPASAYQVDTSTAVPEMQLTLSALHQDDDVWDSRNWEATAKDAQEAQDLYRPDEKYLTDYYLADLIDCAYRPTELKFAAVNPTTKPPESIVGDPHEMATASESTFTPDSTVHLNFPYPACGVRTLVLYDRAPLYYMMQHAERFIGVTATMTSWAQEFAAACANGQPIATVEVNQPDRKPLAHVFLIGLQAGVNFLTGLSKEDAKRLGTEDLPATRTLLEHVGQAVVSEGKKLLVFNPTKEHTERANQAVKEGIWRTFSQGKLTLTGQHDRIANDAYALITYSRSVLGIGANLKQFDVVIVDGFVAKPHHIYMPEKADHLTYLREQELDRTRVIQQNLGRILRSDDPNAVKYVFVCGVNPEQFAHLAKEIAKVTQQPPTCKLYQKDEVLAFEVLVDCIRDGVMPNLYEGEAGDPEVEAKRKPRVNRRKKSPQERIDEMHEKVAERAGAGDSWAQISRAINGNRLDPELLQSLQGCYNELINADHAVIAGELVTLVYPGSATLPDGADARLRVLSAWLSSHQPSSST